jgi:glutamate carboxypeptidase
MERTPGNLGLFKAAQKIGAELGIQLEETTAGGGSDGNTTSLHTPTLDGLGAVGEGAHAPNERIVVASLVERTALLASLLLVPINGAGGA